MFFLIFLAIGCTSPGDIKKEFTGYEVHQCDRILDEAIKKQDFKIHEKFIEGLGNVTSYAASGVGYAGDIIIFTVAGIGIPALICSPVFMIEQHGGLGQHSFNCFGGVHNASYKRIKKSFDDKYLGEIVLDNTAELRCPKIDWLSAALDEVGNCYKKRGETQLYHDHLSRIKQSDFLKRCL